MPVRTAACEVTRTEEQLSPSARGSSASRALMAPVMPSVAVASCALAASHRLNPVRQTASQSDPANTPGQCVRIRNPDHIRNGSTK